MPLLLLAALAFASFQLGRLSRERGHLPPATRRAIRRDRRRSRLGLAEIPTWRIIGPPQTPCAVREERSLDCGCTDVDVCRMHRESGADQFDARLTDAIRKLGDDAPPRGWRARVWSRIRKERARG
jgi:hypothetical protein